MTSDGAGHRTFDRGLAVLTAIADLGVLRVREIAERTGLPPSTTYRYLRSLVAAGLVSADDGRYWLGERLGGSAEAAGTHERFRQAYELLMSNLAARSRETVLLTTRVGLSALVVHSVDSPQSMRLSFNKGNLLPLYAGASAKTLLAFSASEVQDEVLNSPLNRLASNTPTKAALSRQLRAIRDQGYCVTSSEVDEFAVAVGVPVYRGEAVVYALSIAAPAQRCGASAISDLVTTLKSGAEALHKSHI